MMVLLLAQLSLAEGIAIETPPVVGGETAIRVTDAHDDPRVGVTVRVLHRAGLAGERELAIGITDARGRVRWVPEAGGVAEIQADNERARVSIPWEQPPAEALSLLLLLLVGSLGAALYGLWPTWRRTA